MKKNIKINIHRITRVEGHGNVVIDIKKGLIKELRFEIIESPRFFEAILRGRKYDEAQHIMSRICGICAVSHTSASLKAIEDAMGITISKQATLLRKLAFHGEMLQSHILHLYFLVLPDFFKVGSIVPLTKSHPDAVKRGLRLKKLANEICYTIAGRHIHPISLFPGGVAYTPRESELKGLKKRLEDSFEDLEATLELFKTFKTLEYSKKREYLSLKEDGKYAFYDGKIASNLKYSAKPRDYRKLIKESIVPHSVAKHAKIIPPPPLLKRGENKGGYMVGALARVCNNFNQLSPKAKKAAKELGLTPLSCNPFMNNAAQLVESFHCTDDAIKIIDKLLSNGLKKEELKKSPLPPFKNGGHREDYTGIGVVEAPRGTLYHEYTIDKNGIVTDANCIIPTAQNLRIIEQDLRGFVPTILSKPKDEITRDIESLVRAYDPCISCSTHIMDVRFV
ncbi:MAG: Ni/Fe hydrogenase subunit alpha [Deltaproteobacteria bacterium]|nr:Ni/Fe hydrogenase subunit alpha [Deltaproteobacteria bacterium]